MSTPLPTAEDALRNLGLLAPKLGRPPLFDLSVTVVRELMADDLKMPPAPAKPKPLGELKHAHHTVAQLLADGTPISVVALKTGYTYTTIRRLQQDPMFQELVEHYKGRLEEAYVDAHKRLAEVGLLALEEMQRRLADSPEQHTHKELRDTVELTFDRSIAPSKGAPRGVPSGGPVVPQLVVQFIEPKVRPESVVIETMPLRPLTEDTS